MNTQNISVIIPVRNQGNKIGNCLKAILSQSCKPHEIIVVDGHSTDNTVKNAQKFPVTVLYEDYHTRSGACQVGINSASGDWIAFTDADCIPDKDWLSNLSDGLCNNIVGVGGAIKNIGQDFWIHSINLAYGTFLGSANSIQGGIIKNKCFVNSISGCNSIYRKRDLMKAGGFNLKLKGAEDSELNSRMTKIGKLLFVPSAVVLHDHGRNMKDFAEQMLRYGRDRGIAHRISLATIPAFITPFLLISLVVTPWILLSLLAFYIIIILAMGIKLAIQEKNITYIISIPIIYIIEHSLYSFGFWRGFVLRK